MKAYFSKAAAAAAPDVAADMRKVGAGTADAAAIARLSKTPLYNSLMRTTCVATMLEGGHAQNALPQTAKATVNCRMLPGEDPAAVEKTLDRRDCRHGGSPDADRYRDPESGVAVARRSLLDDRRIGEERVGAAAGRSDHGNRRDRWPLSPERRCSGVRVDRVFIAIDDVRAHGKDERILITAFDQGLDFTYDFLKRLTKGQPEVRIPSAKRMTSRLPVDATL